MALARPTRLAPPVDMSRDHVLGNPDAEFELVEYGDYTSPHCHAAHEVIADLRDRFGNRLRYVYRHRPATEAGRRAAELAEYVFATTGSFWPVHDALMKQGPALARSDLERIASQFNLPPQDQMPVATRSAINARLQQQLASAERSGATLAPTFFINGRRYRGPWDENSLAEAMLGTLGHQIHAASLNFARWAGSSGLLLLLMSVAAVLAANSRAGPAFEAWWRTSLGFQFGGYRFAMSLTDWVNHGLLAVFFLVVGLEIKREFTVGRLSTLRAGALPILAAFGGIALPIGIYLVTAPPGPWSAGWGIPIATDTAFAVALIVLLGNRVSIELRVFLTAAVIIDDLVAIAVIALFYTEAIHFQYLVAALAVTALMLAFNRWGIYAWSPYAVLGLLLWVCLHEAGVHATLAGVVLALVTPTRPPPRLHTLLAQAEAIIQAETRGAGESVMRHGPSEPALRALDAIHNRIESPADKLLRSTEPWSSYFVLPVFALANAGVVLSSSVFQTHTRLMLAITLGLVLGKPAGFLLVSWLAVRFGLAEKPSEYSWRQLGGAGVLAGIGFTMSLFIAGEAFPNPADYAAAKIAIFLASILAGLAGTAILWPRRRESMAE